MPGILHVLIARRKRGSVTLCEIPIMASNTDTILIVFVAIVGALTLLQALVLLGIFISLRKAAKSAMVAADDFKATVMPTIHSTRDLIERISPQIVTISAGLAELTATLSKESKGVSFSASEIMDRVNRQSKRLDGMLTHGLDAVERAGEVVETAVAAPIRQVNGIMAAIKAMIDTYRSEPPRRRPVYPSADAYPTDSIDPEF
jgi:hypothetical protein